MTDLLTHRRNDFDFNMGIQRFVDLLRVRESAFMARLYPRVNPANFGISNPSKGFLRVHRRPEGSPMKAYCFIERETGNFFRPDGCGGRHLSVHGNIFKIDPLEGANSFELKRPE